MILLDTHAWVWWVSDPGQLSRPARQAIESSAPEPLRVSAISAWEVALLVARGRLELTLPVAEWVARSEALPMLQFVPVDPQIAVRSTRLPGRLHADPADRMIVATALVLGATLLTKDGRLRHYPHVTSVW